MPFLLLLIILKKTELVKEMSNIAIEEMQHFKNGAFINGKTRNDFRKRTKE